MIGLAVFSTIVGLVYLVLQLWLRRSWISLSTWQIPADFNPRTSVVVIIPARNEATNVKTCLQSILDQDYPKDLLEIILVDDHSEDRTIEFARSFEDERLTVVALEDRNLSEAISPKKRALNIGIAESSADLIVTTDADCSVNEDWIKSIVSFYENGNADLIVGPVLFEPVQSAFERFQALDFIGMMGITGAGIQSRQFHMCNGANLAFSRLAFSKVGGYSGTDHIASGDDILLAQKFVQHPDLNIEYLKSNQAVVTTKPIDVIGDFVSQRLRWGAKSEHYSEKRIIWIQFLVLITCLSLVAFSMLGVVFYYWHWRKYLLAFGILFSLKSIADYLSLHTYAKFFNRSSLLRGFFYASIAHILYIAVVGILSVFIRKHEWKGRKLK